MMIAVHLRDDAVTRKDHQPVILFTIDVVQDRQQTTTGSAISGGVVEEADFRFSLHRKMAYSRRVRVVFKDRLTPRESEAYVAFVEASPFGHYMQMPWFAPVAEAGRYLRSSYMLVYGDGDELLACGMFLRARVRGIPVPFGVFERGPVFRDASVVEGVLGALKKAFPKRFLVRVRMHPYALEAIQPEGGAPVSRRDDSVRRSLLECGLREDVSLDGAHVNTLRLSLSRPTLADVFAGSEREGLRRKIKQAEKAGVDCRVTDSRDVALLMELYNQLMKSQDHAGKPLRWFEALTSLLQDGHAIIVRSDLEGRPISMALFIRHGKQLTYHLGASVTDKMKTSKLVLSFVRAAEWGREQGCTTLDLGGVPEARDTDEKRNMIARFKRDFTTDRVLLGRPFEWRWTP